MQPPVALQLEILSVVSGEFLVTCWLLAFRISFCAPAVVHDSCSSMQPKKIYLEEKKEVKMPPRVKGGAWAVACSRVVCRWHWLVKQFCCGLPLLYEGREANVAWLSEAHYPFQHMHHVYTGCWWEMLCVCCVPSALSWPNACSYGVKGFQSRCSAKVPWVTMLCSFWLLICLAFPPPFSSWLDGTV